MKTLSYIREIKDINNLQDETVDNSIIIKANYKRLWHILLDKNMKKKDLAKKSSHNC